MILDILPESPPAFFNFFAGPNLELVSTLTHSTQPAPPFSDAQVLFLWGETGVGKTHLLKAWAAASHAEYWHASAWQAALAEDQTLFALDAAEALSPAAQIGLFSRINRAREEGGRILVSGERPPARLGLREDLATRLAQGLVFRIHPLSDQDKLHALRLRADARGMRLTDDVARHLLLHCRRDLPHLLAALDALDTRSLRLKRPATIVLLREMLQSET